MTLLQQEAKQARPEPWRLGFSPEECIADADRAVRDGALSAKAAFEILDIITGEADWPTAYDRLSVLYCEGQSSPFPQEFHRDSCDCLLCGQVALQQVVEVIPSGSNLA